MVDVSRFVPLGQMSALSARVLTDSLLILPTSARATVCRTNCSASKINTTREYNGRKINFVNGDYPRSKRNSRNRKGENEKFKYLTYSI